MYNSYINIKGEDMLKDLIFTGLGGALVFKEKIEEELKKLEEKGKIDTKDMKSFLESLEQKGKDSDAKFKEELKLTLTEYINQKRIALAVDMLTYSKLSISEISEKCGFSSQNYFTRVFKAYHKISPSEFRKHV